MPRIPYPTPLFRARMRALGIVPRSPTSQALGATIAALCEAEELPGLLDVRAMIPPTREALVRQVPGHALWVWYDVREPRVWLHTLTRTPPEPVA